MQQILSYFSRIEVRIVLVLLFVGLRLVQFNGDPSGFAVIGSDFSAAQEAYLIQEGAGYDGQFFFAYAHQPASLEKEVVGIQIDHPSYRGQRVGYPTLAYVMSFFGNPELVPWIMILTNVLALIAVFFVWDKEVKSYKLDENWRIAPLLLSGLWMALGRDLGEVFETLFIFLSLTTLLNKNWILFMLSSLFAILFRETSIVLIAGAAGLWLIANSETVFFRRLFVFAWPLLVFIAFKAFFKTHYADFPSVDGSQNLSLPFIGVYQGFMANLPHGGLKEFVEFGFWITYFGFNIWVIVLVVEQHVWTLTKEIINENLIGWTFIIWGVFSICLGSAIYVDDWGFVRIFTAWHLIGLLSLMLKGRKLPMAFTWFGFLLTMSIIGRLILRP